MSVESVFAQLRNSQNISSGEINESEKEKGTKKTVVEKDIFKVAKEFEKEFLVADKEISVEISVEDDGSAEIELGLPKKELKRLKSLVEKFNKDYDGSYNFVLYNSEEGDYLDIDLVVTSVDVKESTESDKPKTFTIFTCDECGALMSYVNEDEGCPECGSCEISEKTVRVVREGKVVKKNTPAVKKRLTAAQKAALAKARKKAHTASANKARKKSMKVRENKGL